MKKVVLIIGLVFLGISGFSQALTADKVPQHIKDRVQFKFPQSIDLPVVWSREKGDYKATMPIMDSPAMILVDSTGKIKRIERRIHDSYLPEKAKKYLKQLDDKYEVVSVLQITDDKEQVTYKTVARIKTDFTFDGKGNSIGKK